MSMPKIKTQAGTDERKLNDSKLGICSVLKHI